MASQRITLLLAIIQLFILITIFSAVTSATETPSVDDDSDEDLSFLDEPQRPKNYPSYADPNYRPQGDEVDYSSFEDFKEWDKPESRPPAIEEKDVVVLNKTNFDEVINNGKYVMVQFYAPWCGYCKQLAPEYAEAAAELKEGGSEVVVAKVDAIEETELADKYKVDGFPTILFFHDGVHKNYEGERTKDGIVSWLKKKTEQAVSNVTGTEDAEDILLADSKLVVAYIDSLTGSDSKILDEAAKQEDDVNFYQTSSPEVAKLFQIDPEAKRPALVLLKKEIEKLSVFDGEFSISGIVDFVQSKKNPLIINFNMETASLVLDSPIQKQVFLFAPSQQYEKLISSLEEAAKSFMGKIMFSCVQMDNEDYGKPMMDFFGVIGDASRVVAYTGNADRRKFFMDEDITSDNIMTFVENFMADKLKPFYKSDPIPEKNDGDVKIVVGENFEEIVLDESKDVLLQIYAPWCSHCKKLEPTYKKLAKHLKDIDTLVIAKMDGTKNEHPKATVQGFPTILFYPAGKKSSDPIIFESNASGSELYKFMRKHATNHIKIHKPSTKPEDNQDNRHITTPTDTPSDSQNTKDEL